MDKDSDSSVERPFDNRFKHLWHGPKEGLQVVRYICINLWPLASSWGADSCTESSITTVWTGIQLIFEHAITCPA